MMRLLYSLIFSLVFVHLAYGQAPKIAIKGGLNISSLTGGNFESNMGCHLGIIGYHQLSEQLFLKPEMFFSLQGGNDHLSTIRLQYINMPILLHYKTNNVFFTVGPQLGLLIQGREKYHETNLKDKITPFFKNPDVSLSFGLGIFITEKLGIEGRYDYSLKNINSTFVNHKLRNQVLQISLFHIIK